MNDSCIFCKIITGDIPSCTVYEDADFKAILDIAPASMGHVLILPKHHADDVFTLDEQSAAKLFPLAKRLAAAVKLATGCEGINLLQNNGEASGQTVRHLHLHIIPRSTGDGVLPEWAHLPYDADALKSVAAAIQGKL